MLADAAISSKNLTQEKTIIGTVTAGDGVTLGYRRVGQSGPGIVIVHGSMESSQSHLELAEALADRYSVYLLDRRGRGMSGPYAKNSGLQQEVDDLEAVLAHTGAHYVFGISAGGIICLQAALSNPAIHKAAIYEPPISLPRSYAKTILTQVDEELAEENLTAALVTGMKAAQMGPPIFNAMPRWLLEGMTNMMLTREDKKAKPDDITFRKLAPTLHYEFQLVFEVSENLDRFQQIPGDVLLLGGSKSPAYLRTSMDMLASLLPDAKRVEFAGLNHGGSGNAKQRGKPEILANELRSFFS